MSTPPSLVPEAREAILAWYAERGRPLAFRRTTDPYAILVSEAMAQQTQAARAAEYWERFMVQFPTVEALAEATPADVLRAWQGLGYDRRALALWRTGVAIVERHGGRVPSTLAELEALPGVGPYTARAVAALAFGMPVGAVDVNVRRVLGRIVSGDADVLPPMELQRLADAAVPGDRPGDWTHAVMDVGATVCKPRVPRCSACPAQPWCRAATASEDGAGYPAGRAGTRTRRIREAAPPFTATRRWLRGRILDRLRAAPDGEWVVLDEAIGAHEPPAVAAALDRMEADGIVELARPGDGVPRARLPLS